MHLNRLANMDLKDQNTYLAKLYKIERYRRGNEYAFEKVLTDKEFVEHEELVAAYWADRMTELVKDVGYEAVNRYLVEELHEIQRKEAEQPEGEDA